MQQLIKVKKVDAMKLLYEFLTRRYEMSNCGNITIIGETIPNTTKQYRYVSSCGLFLKSGNYFIDIPSPKVFWNEKEAEKDCLNKYRFIKNGSTVILAICTEGESYEKGQDSCLVKLNGNLKPLYSEEEWRAAGGRIFTCVERDDGFLEQGDEVLTPWTELFKNEKSDKAIYIDDEAYYIDIINE